MANFPDKQQPAAPKKNIVPVISGATQANRPATRRFFSALLAESPKAVLAKVGRDLVVPRIKQGFEEAFNSFLGSMLWGDPTNRPMPTGVQRTMLRAGGVNYSQISSGNTSALQQAQQATTTSSGSHGNYKDIVCPTQQAAEILLANAFSLLNDYRVVAVADLYEAAGLPTSPSDNAYGWTSLEGARIYKAREGFLLELPLPNLIN